MIKQQLLETLSQTLKTHAERLNLPQDNGVMEMLNIERPRQGGFGDYAVNVSPLAKLARMAPPQIAAIVAEGFSATDWSPSVAGGFLNFQVGEHHLIESLLKLVKADKPGANTAYAEVRCLLEFVSANPTGPLHIGHGRWVALGDSLGRMFRHCGGQVTNEFYINDAGNQMANIAATLWYRSLEILGTGGKLPEPEEGKPYPFYAAEYAIELAKTYVETHQAQILAWDSPTHEPPAEALKALEAYAKEKMLKAQHDLMARCRLTFDFMFSEQTLHDSGHVTQIIETLKSKGMTYEKEGALWFASSRFGDDQDRVLIKSDGKYTYLTADIAYHDEKFRRNNGEYNLIMNIWGADHHGYIPRMKAAVEALGHNPDQLEIILGQLVNLIIDGERTRMGKRKKMLTLEELVDEVGVDAVRYWMVSQSQNTTLDFNVELAASKSDENPVFYVQYAHARCSSILRNAFLPRLDTLSKTELPPILQESEWQAFLQSLTPQALTTLFSGLENDPAATALKELILKLDSFEDRLVESVRQRAPHSIARYTQEVAADFHRLYNVCRILVPDPEVTQIRLVVILALKRVFAQALDLIGVSAPEQM